MTNRSAIKFVGKRQTGRTDRRESTDTAVVGSFIIEPTSPSASPKKAKQPFVSSMLVKDVETNLDKEYKNFSKKFNYPANPAF